MSDVRRQSALLLHGLTGEDREWILAKLGDADRAQLSGHLAELRELGVPADSELIDSALSKVRSKRGRGTRTPRQLLHAASAETMQALLGREPLWLVGTVLGIEPWAWSEGFIAGLDASRRERVRHALRQHVPERLADACIAQLAARLPTVKAAAGPRSAASSFLTRLQQHFSQVVRKWL